MTLQEPHNPPIADVDISDTEVPDTEVIVVAHPSPVFVDSTGRRRRMLRRVAYGFGALCLVYGGLISVSLAGGPVSSSAVLPLPDLADTDEEDLAVARPSPTPVPAGTRAGGPPILEVFPRRGIPVARPGARGVTPRSSSAAPRPTRSPSAKATSRKPSPTPTTPKPAESTSTKPSTPATSPSTTVVPPPPPVPPAPPPVDTSGNGGGAPDDQQDTEAIPAPPAPAEPAPAKPAPAKPVAAEPAPAEPAAAEPAVITESATKPEPSAEPEPGPEGDTAT